MAMINMDVIGIIYSIYEDLLEKVLLTNIPKDCPNLNEIKGNYLKYLINTYQSLRPTITKQEVIDLITSQQKELWADALPYDKYRKFVQDKCFDSLVKMLREIEGKLNLLVDEFVRETLSVKRNAVIYGII